LNYFAKILCHISEQAMNSGFKFAMPEFLTKLIDKAT